MDLSDGLSIDLARLCEESGVAAEIQASSLPLGNAATLEAALHGGEDYELLFTAPSSAKLPRSIGGVAVTAIGQVLSEKKHRPTVTLVAQDGSLPLEPRGWEHFARGD